jgi:hypothetical protein
MTWHYIFEKTNPRLLKYQRLTAHTHAATVEDQFDAYCDDGEELMRCGMRLIGVTRLPILLGGVIELVVVAVAIGGRRSFAWVVKPPAWRT